MSVFDTPVVDIFASQKVEEKDDIFGSSVKEPLKKPEKSLDELLSGKTGREEVDRGEKVRERRDRERGGRGREKERKGERSSTLDEGRLCTFLPHKPQERELDTKLDIKFQGLQLHNLRGNREI